MSLTRSINGLFLLVALAALGLLMVWAPAQIVQHYHAVKEFGSFWVTVYFIVVGSGALLLAGSSGYLIYTLWWRGRKKQQRRERGAKNPSELTHTEREQEYTDNLQTVAALQDDPRTAEELKRVLQPLVSRLETKRQGSKLEIVAFGTISSGKSSLLNALAGRDLFATDLQGGTTNNRQEMPWRKNCATEEEDRLVLVDTPGLAEIDGANHMAIAAEAARDADLVLMVVDGPLRDSEHLLLAKLGEMEKKIVVCLNKIDWYHEQDRAELVGQLRKQTAEFVSANDVVCVRSQTSMRTRLRVTTAGEELEESVPVPADIAPLAERMQQIVQREGQDLLLANLLMQSRGLVEEAKQTAQAALDKRAWELVDRYTWGAGGVAALSPTPVLDLLAGSAITTKMVVDLASVYKQDVDLKIAMELLGQLGKNLLAILGVAAAGPAVTSAVATLLKTVPGAGTIAGGVLQGVVQALVTRWIGAVFIEYFRNEMQAPQGGLAALARRQWQHITSAAEMHRFLSAARTHLLGRHS